MKLKLDERECPMTLLESAGFSYEARNLVNTVV